MPLTYRYTVVRYLNMGVRLRKKVHSHSRSIKCLYTCIYFAILKMLISNIFDKNVVFSSKVMSQINSGSGIKKKLFNMALASKENELKK